MRSTLRVEQGLSNKGFRLQNSHHRYFVYFTLKGEKSCIKTRTSHGSRDLNDYLLRHMAKQCGLATTEFLRLVDCPMTQEEYEKTVAPKL